MKRWEKLADAGADIVGSEELIDEIPEKGMMGFWNILIATPVHDAQGRQVGVAKLGPRRSNAFS